MTRLAHPEELAENLETGLGEIDPLWSGHLPSELRLRRPVCGIVSVALALSFRRAGYTVQVAKTSPRWDMDRGATHVFPIIKDGDTPVVVDATYSSFLSYAGLTAEGVMDGQEATFPEEKIIVFEAGDTDTPSTKIVEAVPEALRSWRNTRKEWLFPPTLAFLSQREMKEDMAQFWDVSHSERFIPSDYTKAAASRLARYVAAEHVRLID